MERTHQTDAYAFVRRRMEQLLAEDWRGRALRLAKRLDDEQARLFRERTKGRSRAAR